MQDDFAAEGPIESVEPAQPIHANLIQFPREMVATRRMRPRIDWPSRWSLGRTVRPAEHF